jgi:hypothetical protein
MPRREGTKVHCVPSFLHRVHRGAPLHLRCFSRQLVQAGEILTCSFSTESRPLVDILVTQLVLTVIPLMAFVNFRRRRERYKIYSSVAGEIMIRSSTSVNLERHVGYALAMMNNTIVIEIRK